MTSDFLNEAAYLVRAPLDPATGQPLDKCEYALFPGLALAQSEPELVVLMYDSLRHQHPDLAIFLCKGREGADPLLNRKWSERLLTRWRSLGKPTVIVTNPEDMKFFRRILTEIPVVSIYDEMLSHNISGGCSRELYRISEPDLSGAGGVSHGGASSRGAETSAGFEPAVRELAENMGAVLYEAGSTGTGSAGADGADGADGGEAGTSQPEIDPADVSKIPFLTSSIDVRNAMKKNGFEAVHILELIYGMGRSNQHLAHTHDGAHDHDHDAPPKVRETTMDASEQAALEELFSREAQKRNLQEVHDTLLSLYWAE